MTKERLLAKVGNYDITVNPSGRSGYIEPGRMARESRSNGWICYGNGRMAFDYPEILTAAVRRKLVAYCRRIPSRPFGRAK